VKRELGFENNNMLNADTNLRNDRGKAYFIRNIKRQKLMKAILAPGTARDSA